MQSWKETYLDKCCEVNYGTRVVKKKDAGSIYPVYGGGDATFFMDSYNREDCLVVARFAMSEKCTRFVNGKFFLNDSGLTVKPKVEELTQDFLNWQLIYLNDQIYSLGRGSAQKNLNIDLFKKLPIRYPNSKTTQSKIAQTLQSSFANIEVMKQKALANLNNAKYLYKSYLNQIFIENASSYKWVTLPEISTNLDKKRKPITKSARVSGKYPYYGASGIVDYVNDFIFNENILLVSEDGGNLLMRTYPIAFSVNEKCWVNNHAHVLKFENHYSQKLVEYFLNFINLENYITGAAQPKLNQAALNSIKIPKIEDDNKLKETIEHIEHLKTNIIKLEQIYTRKNKALDELKSSILQKAFKGDS